MLRGTEGYRPATADVEPGGPPSSYAVAAVLDREPGAVPRLVGLTALRSLFIIPTLWVGSKIFARSLSLWQVILLGAFASAGISGGMLVWYAAERRIARLRGQVARLPAFDGMAGWRQ